VSMSQLPRAWKLGRVKTQVLHALRTVSTIEASTKARGDISNHDRAELARLALEKALEEMARVESLELVAP
jgi:hypothetical protein